MPRRPAHIDTLDHLRRLHQETGEPVHAERLSEATGRNVKTIANHMVKLKAEDLITAHGDSTYEPTKQDATDAEPQEVTPRAVEFVVPLDEQAHALDAEAKVTRERLKTLRAEQRAAQAAHSKAIQSFMDGAGSTAQDVQAASGLVETITSAINGLDERLAALAERGREITQAAERSHHLEAAADAAKRAMQARSQYLDRFAAARPQVLEIARGVVAASEQWQEACKDFYEHGRAAGLPPLDEAETSVAMENDGITSSTIVPASGVRETLNLIADALAAELPIDQAEAAVAAAQEGHRMGTSPLTRDLHHQPLWTRAAPTQPPGGDASRLLVRSLIDLALEADI